MFTELNGKELMETDGGFPWTPVIVIGIIVSGCLASCSNSCDKWFEIRDWEICYNKYISLLFRFIRKITDESIE